MAGLVIAVCALAVSGVLVLRFGHPQWHPWIYRFQAYVSPGYPLGIVPFDPHYTGVWRIWDRQGRLTTRYPLVRGQIHGVGLTFHENGAVALLSQVRYGMDHGVKLVFSKHGELVAEDHFAEDRREGLSRRWYLNGQLRMRGSYRDRKRDGEWVWYGEDGTLLGRGVYRDGRPWEGVFEVGEFDWKFEEYQQGEPVDEPSE